MKKKKCFSDMTEEEYTVYRAKHIAQSIYALCAQVNGSTETGRTIQDILNTAGERIENLIAEQEV